MEEKLKVQPAASWTAVFLPDRTAYISQRGTALLNPVGHGQAATLGKGPGVGAREPLRQCRPLHDTEAGNPVAYFTGMDGRIRDVVRTPNGGLWLMTNNENPDFVPVLELRR